ncbi:MAG: serine hydrolase [Desulfobacterota bacterium]|nr:serine hydrolase [Thermodesulfobacteriota bacterium]
MDVGPNVIEKVFKRGLDDGVFPGAVALVAQAGKIVFFEHVGHRSLMPERSPMKSDTIFDLASLTKVFATVPTIMKLVTEGRIDLDDPLSKLIPSAALGDKKDLTLRLLLAHSAGLVDWKPFYEKLREHALEKRKSLLREWIIEEPFAYEPGKGSLYSDLGFMLLEWVIEEQTGETLLEFVKGNFYGTLGLRRTLFGGGEGRGQDAGLAGDDKPILTNTGRDFPREEFAATEDCPWRKRVLQGEVHDDNAWTLGGHSGHAGLFSTAEEIFVMANMLREHYQGKREDFFKPKTVREFIKRQEIVKGSDWAIGWDTRAFEGSSAGKYFSRDSVGHTGFTGTSIWMDLERDVIAILLSNRVHPKRDNDKIKQFRPLFHDAVMEELGLVN